MTKDKFIEELDLMYVNYYEDGCSKNDLIVGVRRLREKYIDSDKNSVLPSIISESDCDYRNKECTNEGEIIDGKWVCFNHKRTAVCVHCGKNKSDHTKASQMCTDRFKHYEKAD